MPTGYTEVIKDGITFEQFALRCARQFGALVEMRDLPLDAPIPERFTSNAHYANKAKDTKAKRDRLLDMSDRELCELARAEREARLSQIKTRVKEIKAERRKAFALLEKINKWNPPTADHKELKKFMFTQVELYIAFDADPSIYDKEIKYWNKDFEIKSYCDEMIAKAGRAYDDAVNDLIKENARILSCNKWIKQLRDSLKATEK